ncbi:hypothetical protein Drorol1_Dr00008437 [Drosera rotundifolia]
MRCRLGFLLKLGLDVALHEPGVMLLECCSSFLHLVQIWTFSKWASRLVGLETFFVSSSGKRVEIIHVTSLCTFEDNLNGLKCWLSYDTILMQRLVKYTRLTTRMTCKNS